MTSNTAAVHRKHSVPTPSHRISVTATMLLLLSWSCCLLSRVASLSSSFHGRSLLVAPPYHRRRSGSNADASSMITMRKQKASDKHTARRQRGLLEPPDTDTGAYSNVPSAISQQQQRQVLSSSAFTKNGWKDKKIELRASGIDTNRGNVLHRGGGRGRARKRYNLYNSLLGYHTQFLGLIQREYRMEVSVVPCFLIYRVVRLVWVGL